MSYWWKQELGSVKWDMYYTLNENLNRRQLNLEVWISCWSPFMIRGQKSCLMKVYFLAKCPLSSLITRTYSSGGKIHYGCPNQRKETTGLRALPYSIRKRKIKENCTRFNNVHVCSFFCTWHWRPLSTALLYWKSILTLMKDTRVRRISNSGWNNPSMDTSRMSLAALWMAFQWHTA